MGWALQWVQAPRNHLPAMQDLIPRVTDELLPHLRLESLNPYDPVVVQAIPSPWQLVGTGNYAAVVQHPDYPEQVIKVYAPGRSGFPEEVEVYRRLGKHPAFSECYYAADGFLILKRLHGITLYDCLHRGIKIPAQVIEDIDQALDYAQFVGLTPHDVHGKNVMMAQGRGLVVDVSDFLEAESCSAWDDLKRAYYWVYLPIFSRFSLKFPYKLLDLVRFVYRSYRR